MNIKDIVKEAVAELLLGTEATPAAAPTPAAATNHPLIGKDVVVRCRLAGVHYGTLESVDGFVVLQAAHRIWSWQGAFTLSEVSQSGVTKGRVACQVPLLTIPMADVGEILPLTYTARELLDSHIEG